MIGSYLDKTHPSSAYQCGRIMATLSFSQEQALGKVNASIIRRHLSGVVAAPAANLGRLQILAEVSHIPKLDGNMPSMIRDELKQISCAIGSEVPKTFDHGDQSYFMLGFYQQLARLETMRSSRRHRLRTKLGDWVISRGEQLVANSLAAHDVRYTYEPKAVLKKGQNRVPDFLVSGGQEKDNIYIEYLGMDTPAYNKRWENKFSEYIAAKITEEGGERGRLVIIDDRKLQRDQAAIITFLISTNVISNDSKTQPPSEED